MFFFSFDGLQEMHLFIQVDCAHSETLLMGIIL